jgi:endonuclease YncB( thermonuclease family)
MAKQPRIKTNFPVKGRFQKLVDDIARLYADARRAQVQFAWETGRRIVQEEQNGSVRAQYGAKLIPMLSQALTKKYGSGFSENTLLKMRKFYTLHQIPPMPVELDWSDHVELLPVKDEKTRKSLERLVLKENLNSQQLRRLVHNVRAFQTQERPEAPTSPAKKFSPLKRPTGLKLNTFSVSKLPVKLRDGYVLVDCGFFVNWWVKKEGIKQLDLVEEMSYTYAATIERVIDGDTLLVLIEAGFGIIVRERLRLRGVNAPELATPEGMKAKKFVEKLLPAGSAVAVKSHKSKTDIHGRFVVDVFFKDSVENSDVLASAASAASVPEDAVYLNQYLLDCGHAVRMEG